MLLVSARMKERCRRRRMEENRGTFTLFFVADVRFIVVSGTIGKQFLTSFKSGPIMTCSPAEEKQNHRGTSVDMAIYCEVIRLGLFNETMRFVLVNHRPLPGLVASLGLDSIGNSATEQQRPVNFCLAQSPSHQPLKAEVSTVIIAIIIAYVPVSAAPWRSSRWNPNPEQLRTRVLEEQRSCRRSPGIISIKGCKEDELGDRRTKRRQSSFPSRLVRSLITVPIVDHDPIRTLLGSRPVRCSELQDFGDM
ncbi:hypothetical protein ACLB2K_061450 [Fragaria x ananassa]